MENNKNDSNDNSSLPKAMPPKKGNIELLKKYLLTKEEAQKIYAENIKGYEHATEFSTVIYIQNKYVLFPNTVKTEDTINHTKPKIISKAVRVYNSEEKFKVDENGDPYIDNNIRSVKK